MRTSTTATPSAPRLAARGKGALALAAALSLGLSACSDDTSQPDGTETTTTAAATDGAGGSGSGQSVEQLFEKVQNNAPTSERVGALEDIGMHYYWYGGDVEKAEEEVFQGITLHGDYGVVEEAFRQAVQIDPYDPDLRYSLASAQILQKEVSEARDTYEQLLRLDEDQFNARLLHAVYSRVDGDEDAFDADFAELEQQDAERAQAYRERVASVEQVETEPLNDEVPADLPERDHAFIVLGYALSDEGEMQDTLRERLRVALEAAEQYPDSLLIVSGGVPKNGNTEAELMAEWLVDNGVAEDRIREEDLATDTVENALFSLDIAEEEGIESHTVISSATHMRRALVVFNEVYATKERLAGEDAGRDSFSNVVYQDFESEEEQHEVSQEERLVIYRDLMRASGIWAFPGLQR